MTSHFLNAVTRTNALITSDTKSPANLDEYHKVVERGSGFRVDDASNDKEIAASLVDFERYELGFRFYLESECIFLFSNLATIILYRITITAIGLERLAASEYIESKKFIHIAYVNQYDNSKLFSNSLLSSKANTVANYFQPQRISPPPPPLPPKTDNLSTL